MESTFDPNSLSSRLKKASFPAQLAFLLSCVERLGPNYAAFHRKHGWGDVKALEEALDLGWRTLGGETIEKRALEKAYERCERASPDTEEFDSEVVSPGLDAMTCAGLMLEFVIARGGVQRVVDCASLARDTVDMFVQELENMRPQDPQLEDKILRHPLMQAELRRQREDLDLLLSADFNPEFVKTLMSRWRHPSTSNIGLSGE